ncbi:unnamed protein product [Closterium sp. NIES-54]
MDHFLSLDHTSLTVDQLKEHLLAVETSAVAVGAARDTPRTPFFEGCPPSPLAPSYASAAAADVPGAKDVKAASASAKRRSGKGKGGRGGGSGSGVGGGGSSGGGGSGGSGGGSGGSGGGGGSSGWSSGSGSGGTGGGRTGAQRGGSGGGQRQQQQRRSEAQSGVAIFELDFAAILTAMCGLSVSAEGDCYRCVPPDPGIEAAALGASESALLDTARAEALHTFTLDSSDSRCFFRDSTTLTPLSAPVPVKLADPSGGPLVARSSIVLLCPAVPSGSLSGLHLPSFSTKLVRTAALQDSMVTNTTPGGQRVSICTCTRTGRHLATFTRWQGSSLYTLATESPQVAASAQVSASGQGPAPSDVSQVDPLPGTMPVEPRGVEPGGAESEGAGSGVAEPAGVESGGAEPEGVELWGADSGGADPRGTASSGGPASASLRLSPLPEPLSLQQLREWFTQRTHLRSGATGAGDSAAGDNEAGGARVTAGADGTGGAAAAGPGGARSRGTGAVETGSVGGAGAGDTMERGAAGAGGTGAGGNGAGVDGAGGAGSVGAGAGGACAGGAGAGGAGAVDPGAGGAGAGGAVSGGTGAGGVGATRLGGTGVTAGAGGTGGAAVAGPGGARPRGTRAAGTGSVGDTGVGDHAEPGGAGVRGNGAGGTGASGAGVGAGDPGAVGARAGGPGVAGGARAGGAVFGGTGAGGIVRPRPYFIPLLQQNGGPAERCEPASHPTSPVCTGRRVPHPRPPPVPGTHAMALRPSSVPLCIPLLPPLKSSLPTNPDPESDGARAASPTVSRLLATVVTDPSFESTSASALVAELVDFAASCRLDYSTALVAESESASPPSVGGECALGMDVLQDKQEDFECLAADTDMDAKMASWKSTGIYVDAVPPSGANIVDGMWIFKELHSLDFSTYFLQGSLHEEIWLRRPAGFTESFPAGTQWSLRQPVYHIRHASREWHDTMRTILAALGFAPSTADLPLFLRTDTLLPPFYIIMYVDNLVFATADTEALTLVKSEL